MFFVLRPQQLFGLDNRLSDVFHLSTLIAGALAQTLVGIALAKAQPLHQDALGTLDQLARLERLLELVDLRAQALEFFEARQSDIDRRRQFGLIDWFD